MASALPEISSCCATDCPDETQVLVPGPTGPAGTNGTNGSAGVNAWTTLTAAFTVPAVSGNVVIQVGNSTWMAGNQIIYIQNAGYYRFVSSTSSTNATVTNLGYTGNAAPTTSIAPANKVSPAGLQGAAGADGTDATDVTTTKGDLITRNSTDLVRKAVGTNGQVFTADSAQATGNKWAAIDLSGVNTSISGATPIANGGTGQTTANPAFNALSPVTTRGDLIVRNATVNARLPIGAANTGLFTDGTDPSWRKLVQADVAAGGPMSRYGLLGSLIGADMNVTTDQAITILSGVTKYIIRRIIALNASSDFSSGTAPLGGIYTNAAKAGTIIVAAAQSYVSLTAAAKFKDLTLEAVVGTDVRTEGTLYLSLSTARGAAATADFFIFGEVVQ